MTIWLKILIGWGALGVIGMASALLFDLIKGGSRNVLRLWWSYSFILVGGPIGLCVVVIYLKNHEQEK